MAAPFKRICVQATRQRLSRIQSPYQRQSLRPISTTPSRQAEELQQRPTLSNEAHDPALNSLAKRSGVKYTITQDDPDLASFDQNDISSLAHRELEQHRELREIVRLAAWEMPLLSSLAKPFEPPREEQVLRWRYTTYLGESHPAANKVVVEFRPERLQDLSEAQREKLLKLAGPRYNPETKVMKMSCESFETQAQNKRYLADTISTLIAEAKDDQADSFADVPLDTRHHKPRRVYRFPESWAMTPERKAKLEERRRNMILEEGQRVEQDRLVSGMKAIEEARGLAVEEVEQPVMVEARRELSRGKMGKREMGERRSQR